MVLLNDQNQLEKNELEVQKQRPNFLPLAPVNMAYVPVNALDPAKSKCVIISTNKRWKQLSHVVGNFVRQPSNS